MDLYFIGDSMKVRILKYLTAMIIVFAMLLIAGCGNSNNSLGIIGFVFSGVNNPFVISMKNGAEDTAKAEGYKIIVLNSQNDSAKELSNVQALVRESVQIIIINPTDSRSVSSAINYANEHNIPIIMLDSTTDAGKVLSHIESNNIAGGKMAAQYMIDRLNNNGEVIELSGLSDISASKERSKGFNDEIAKSDINSPTNLTINRFMISINRYCHRQLIKAVNPPINAIID